MKKPWYGLGESVGYNEHNQKWRPLSRHRTPDRLPLYRVKYANGLYAADFTNGGPFELIDNYQEMEIGKAACEDHFNAGKYRSAE